MADEELAVAEMRSEDDDMLISKDEKDDDATEIMASMSGRGRGRSWKLTISDDKDIAETWAGGGGRTGMNGAVEYNAVNRQPSRPDHNLMSVSLTKNFSKFQSFTDFFYH